MSFFQGTILETQPMRNKYHKDKFRQRKKRKLRAQQMRRVRKKAHRTRTGVGRAERALRIKWR